jgi:hypothetical protein
LDIPLATIVAAGQDIAAAPCGAGQSYGVTIKVVTKYAASTIVPARQRIVAANGSIYNRNSRIPEKVINPVAYD